MELRADLGAGERSLVELAAREFALHYRAAHAHETTLQVTRAPQGRGLKGTK